MLPLANLLPRDETPFRIPLIYIPKIFKDFFACRIVLAANHQSPENNQRIFRLQNFLTIKTSISRKNPKNFRLASSIPAATGNHPAINNSNQQQRSAAATSNSHSQQQPATAASIHPPTHTHAATSNRPTDICTTIASLRYLS